MMKRLLSALALLFIAHGSFAGNRAPSDDFVIPWSQNYVEIQFNTQKFSSFVTGLPTQSSLPSNAAVPVIVGGIPYQFNLGSLPGTTAVTSVGTIAPLSGGPITGIGSIQLNFSSTSLANCSGSLCIASNAVLPGSPTTTTPGSSDNSTKVATTAYVQTAIGSVGGTTLGSVSSNTALTAVSTATVSKQIRTGFNANGDAPTAQLFVSSAGVCTKNSAFTGAISTTTLTVTGITVGQLYIGAPVTGTGVTAGTVVTAYGTGRGGNGTYVVNNSQSISAEAMVGTGDGGSQVPSADSKCWLAVFPNGPTDIRQFGAKCDGSSDDSVALTTEDASIVDAIGVAAICVIANTATLSHSLWIGQSGQLSVSSSFTLTIHDLRAVNATPFAGSGTVAITSSRNSAPLGYFTNNVVRAGAQGFINTITGSNTEGMAQVVGIWNGGTIGGIGVLGGIRASDITATNGQAFGVIGFGDCNNTNTTTGCWGGYFPSYVSAAGGGTGVEINPVGQSGAPTSPIFTPYNWTSQLPATIGLQLASGDPGHSSGATDAVVAINVANNTTKFKTGINIASNALTGCTGADSDASVCSAINLGRLAAIEFYNSGNTTTPYAKYYSSSQSSTLNGIDQVLFGTAIFFNNDVDGTTTVEIGGSGTGNFTDSLFLSGGTSNNAEIIVNSTNSNANFTISPKGSGTIKVGNTGSFNGTVSNCGSLASSHECLVILDNTGRTSYIPVY